MVPWYAGRARRAHPVRGKGISHLDQFGNQTNLSPEEADDGRDREEFVMEYHRKQAKALVRAYRAGEREAVRRVEAILGDRARERFLLSDAQHVVAREQGYRTWHELKHAQEWRDGKDVVFDTGLHYAPGQPVEVVVRKRGWRFDVSDGGQAVDLAGRGDGWLDAAQQIADAHALNVNRRGLVFVQSNEERLERLIPHIADCSVAIYQELLERELGSP